MKYFRSSIFIITLFLVVTNLHSQIEHADVPLDWSNKSLKKISEVPIIQTPELDMEIIKKEDLLAEEDQNQFRGSKRFGIKRSVEIDFFKEGLCSDLKDGGSLWRLGVYSPDATSINFTFNNWYIPKGAKVTIWNKDRTTYLGSFTNENNKEYRRFATNLIYDDKVYIEYVESINVIENAVINIDNIIQGYKSPLIDQKRNVKPAAGEGFGASADCNININCNEGKKWKKQKRGVVLILTEGNKACTGSLINNTKNNGEPYLLTATHCFDLKPKEEVKDFVFIFNYESKNCSNGRKEPKRNQSIVGASIITSLPTTTDTSGPLTDLTLLKISKQIPSAYKPYFNGWDRSGKAPKRGVVGIHHPNGDIKKISVQNTKPKKGTLTDQFTVNNPLGIKLTNKGPLWFTKWNKGVTAAGSSGSPLFSKDNGLIIGQLRGGQSVCGNVSMDEYGAFDISWKKSRALRKVLVPNGAAPLTLKGYDPGSNNKVNLEENLDDFNVKLYPNPVVGNLTIGWNRKDTFPKKIMVSDITGTINYQQKIQSDNDLSSINLENLTTGIYFISIYLENNEVINKRIFVRK